MIGRRVEADKVSHLLLSGITDLPQTWRVFLPKGFFDGVNLD